MQVRNWPRLGKMSQIWAKTHGVFMDLSIWGVGLHGERPYILGLARSPENLILTEQPSLTIGPSGIVFI